MSDKLQIPKAIRDAVHNALASYPVAANTGHAAEIACEAFTRALSEHPIEPTDEQMNSTYLEVYGSGLSEASDRERIAKFVATIQRRMFEAPEPEVPEAIKDLIGKMEPPFPAGEYQWMPIEQMNSRIIEAYRRGKESREP